MKFSGGERRAKGRVRLLRARGSAQLREVASCSAAQGLWLRNGKVGSQVRARVWMSVTKVTKRGRRRRRRIRAREGQEKRERENRRPILRKLCAALLRSFRRQHSKKMKGSA